MAVELSDPDILRYARHLSLAAIGYDGQIRLRNAKILVIGAGGLGSALLFYLAGAGIGSITIIDDDTVEASNLQRQIIHREQTVGQPKVTSAALALAAYNSGVRINPLAVRAKAETILPLLAAHDVIADASDNFATRQLLNAVAIAGQKPLVSAAAIGMMGQVSTFTADSGCYACLYGTELPQHAASCATAGVLGAVCGVIGSLQTTEIIKQILRLPDDARGRLLQFDAAAYRFHDTRYTRMDNCPVCHSQSTAWEFAHTLDSKRDCA